MEVKNRSGSPPPQKKNKKKNMEHILVITVVRLLYLFKSHYAASDTMMIAICLIRRCSSTLATYLHYVFAVILLCLRPHIPTHSLI